jgi:hypothetical protein
VAEELLAGGFNTAAVNDVTTATLMTLDLACMTQTMKPAHTAAAAASAAPDPWHVASPQPLCTALRAAAS